MSTFGAGAAQADTVGPAIKFFKSPLPVVGGVLSDSSGTPSLQMKDGWAVNDADGICSAYMNYYGSGARVWNAPQTGRTVTSLIGNTYTGTARVGSYSYLQGYGTDCLGNSSSSYHYWTPALAQQGAASYSAGWTTSSGAVFSGGSVMYSTKVGATATYSFSGTPLISLVSNKASNRGKVSISVDGGTAKTVTLTASANSNRTVVYNSPYLTTNGSHLLTVKVVSGRVDIDGFLTQYPY